VLLGVTQYKAEELTNTACTVVIPKLHERYRDDTKFSPWMRTLRPPVEGPRVGVIEETIASSKK
jgi:hypothetical protein